MSKKLFPIFLIVCLALSLFSTALAQEETATINVTYNISYGGLLWVNGTSIVNASVISYENDTLLVLSATPTNANYSYTSMDLNNTITTDNPALYNLTSSTAGISNQTIAVNFTAEAIPTPTPSPDPDALTIDDATGLAVVALLFAVALPCVFYAMRRRES